LILFDAIADGILFLIFFSDCLLLVYKNATDFCATDTFSTTSLNLFISSGNFLVDFLRFSSYRIMSSVNRDSFTSFSPVWMPSVSYLPDLAGTSRMMSNSSAERHLCLVLILGGNSQPLTITMFAMGFS